MSRRLSITVSDDLWDAVSHLDDTQSGVVQKALIRLRDEEGALARTDFEKEAEFNPTYESALLSLQSYAEDSFQEGYEHLIDALSAGVIWPGWIENAAAGYSPSKLGGKLADAGDAFVTRRHSDPDGSEKWIKEKISSEDLLEFLDRTALPGDWGGNDYELLKGLGAIIVSDPNESNYLSGGTNSAGWVHFGPDGSPKANVPLLLWEGIAAAIFDAVAAMHRAVRVSPAPRKTTDSDWNSDRRLHLIDLDNLLSDIEILQGGKATTRKAEEETS